MDRRGERKQPRRARARGSGDAMTLASSPAPDSTLWQAFQPMDRYFARFLERLSGAPNSPLVLATALLSRSRGEGHLCLDLHRVCDPGFVGELVGHPDAELAAAWPGLFPSPEDWSRALRETRVVGRPGEFKPLILDDRGRLYLQRYWNAENELARSILERADLRPG